MTLFKLKQIALFTLMLIVLAALIGGGVYLMFALGDAMPTIIQGLL